VTEDYQFNHFRRPAARLYHVIDRHGPMTLAELLDISPLDRQQTKTRLTRLQRTGNVQHGSNGYQTTDTTHKRAEEIDR